MTYIHTDRQRHAYIHTYTHTETGSAIEAFNQAIVHTGSHPSNHGHINAPRLAYTQATFAYIQSYIMINQSAIYTSTIHTNRHTNTHGGEQAG